MRQSKQIEEFGPIPESELHSIPQNDSASSQTKGLSAANFLRSLGAFAVIASLSLFTLQGWSEGNDISRYLTLLSQTALLVASGFLLNWLIKERKGARMFLILALGSVVANITILGALLYSFLPLDQNLVEYPAMMRWVVTSPGTFIPLASASMAVLMGFSYFAFSVLARPIAKQLTLSLFVLSVILLTPVREPLLALGLGIIALFIAINKVRTTSKDASVVKTFETRVAFGILFLPSIVIVARAVLLYPIEPFVYSLFSLIAYFGLRYWRTQFGSHFLLEAASCITIICAMITIGASLDQTWLAFLASMACALILSVDQMRECRDEKTRSVIAGLLSFILAPLVLTAVAFEGSIVNIAIGLATNASIVGINFLRSKKGGHGKAMLITSCLVFVATLLSGGVTIIETIVLGNWILLGLLGVLLIFGSSVIEWYKKSSK